MNIPAEGNDPGLILVGTGKNGDRALDRLRVILMK